MSYDSLAPTISSKAKKCLVPVTWVKIIGGGGGKRCPFQMDWTLSFRFQLTTLGKLFTHMCLSQNSIIWYRSRGGDALRLGRKP